MNELKKITVKFFPPTASNAARISVIMNVGNVERKRYFDHKHKLTFDQNIMSIASMLDLQIMRRENFATGAILYCDRDHLDTIYKYFERTGAGKKIPKNAPVAQW